MTSQPPVSIDPGRIQDKERLTLSRVTSALLTASMGVAFFGIAITQPVIFERPLLTATLWVGLLALVYCDLRWRRLPDLLTLPLIAIGIASSIEESTTVWAVSGAFLGYGVVWTLRRIWLSTRSVEGIGLGDAKLLAAAGAWLGPLGLPFVLLCASGLGLTCVGAFYVTRRKMLSSVPFGPFLALGMWIGWNLMYLQQL